MVRPILPDDDMDLADRLKREALEARPAFSESLHTRICRGVACAAAAPPGRAGTPRRWPRIAYAAAAALLVLGAPLVAWWLGPRSVPQPHPPEAPPAVVQTPDPLDELYAHSGTPGVVAAIDSNPSVQDWADLQHDARMATRMLLDQLPLEMTLPAEEP